MKKIITLFSLLLAGIYTLHAQDTYKWAVTKQKNFSKTHPIGSAVVTLKNQFGKMEIRHWEKNEVKLEATILVSTQEEAYANTLLDMIQVVEKAGTDTISFTTQFGDENKGWSTNQSNKMSIDYIVYLPASAKLKAHNSFGPMQIGNHNGEADIQSSHGSLTAGDLANIKSLKVSFSKAKIGKLGKTEADFRHSSIDIEELTGDIKATVSFCNSLDIPVSNSVKNIDINTSHTSIYLLLPKTMGGEYDIATTHATATGKGSFELQEEKKADNLRNRVDFNHHYTGKLGNGGDAKINIKSNFGSVRLL